MFISFLHIFFVKKCPLNSVLLQLLLSLRLAFYSQDFKNASSCPTASPCVYFLIYFCSASSSFPSQIALIEVIDASLIDKSKHNGSISALFNLFPSFETLFVTLLTLFLIFLWLFLLSLGSLATSFHMDPFTVSSSCFAYSL